MSSAAESRLAIVLVALGSNLGNRRESLDAAAKALRALDEGGAWACSTWLETEPVGGPRWQGRYLNGVCRFATRLAPMELLERLLQLERDAGRLRTRGERDEPRPLDLDLLIYGDRRIDEPELQVPHPRMEARSFVLGPLAQIEPDRVLPVCGRTVQDQLALLSGAEPSNERDESPMRRWNEPSAAAAWAEQVRVGGRTLGFVPTMGALHEGHLALVRKAVAENDVVAVSVFVNPLQFDDATDLARYPRDFDADCELLEREGCSAVFTGELSQFFPESVDGEIASVAPGGASLGLEGACRTGHFEGVATIVSRLFELMRPVRAYFGQKDFQQTLVVREVARALGYPDIEVVATSRDPDGLARSSRNTRLAPEERIRALALARALAQAHAEWDAGERDADRLCLALLSQLEGLDVEYAEVRDPEVWSAERPQGLLSRAQALVAARVGPVRLIDNSRLDAAAPLEFRDLVRSTLLRENDSRGYVSH